MSRFRMWTSALVLVVTACASSPDGPSDGMAGVAPMLSVERFLQAANVRDLEAMARIFGTVQGPIADRAGNTFSCAFKKIGSWIGLGDPCLSWSEIELRMNAIALILEHDDYRVRGEANVAGRTRPTTRVGVDLERGDQEYADVPFVVVQTSEGRWLIEEIGLEQITTASRAVDAELHGHRSAAAGRSSFGGHAGFGAEVADGPVFAADPLRSPSRRGEQVTGLASSYR